MDSRWLPLLLGFQNSALANFDVVIIMDWLEAHSLLQVDWHNKWLVVPYDG